MNTAIAQTLLKVGLGGVASLITILEEIAPILATLGPDVAAIITDFNKLLVDVQAKGSTLVSAVTTAVKTGAPAS